MDSTKLAWLVASACACASSTLRSCAPQSPHRSDSPAIAAAAADDASISSSPQQIRGEIGEQAVSALSSLLARFF